MSKTSTLFYYLDTYCKGHQKELIEYLLSIEEEDEIELLLSQLKAYESDIEEEVLTEILNFAKMYREELQQKA